MAVKKWTMSKEAEYRHPIDILPEAKTILEKHFNVLGYYNISTHIQNPQFVLKSIEHDHKGSYNHNDRLVFLLFDHDFYLDGKGPGWALYNLQLIFRYLDITNRFALILTHQSCIDTYSQEVQKIITSDDTSFGVIKTCLNRQWIETIDDPGSNSDQIQKSYCLLSRQSRPHRTYFTAKLWEHNLLDQGIVGYNNIDETKDQDTTTGVLPRSTTPCLVEQEFLYAPKSYQRLTLRNKNNQTVYQQFDCKYKSYKNFEDQIDIYNKYDSMCFDRFTPIQQALVYVGIETQYNIDVPFWSRISLRGILERRPFVIVGCPGVLAQLQEHGFKTFNEFWSEDYDRETDFERRVDMIIEILQKFSGMSPKQLTNLYQRMQTILDYNFDYYSNHFKKQQIDLFDTNCERNLNT